MFILLWPRKKAVHLWQVEKQCNCKETLIRSWDLLLLPYKGAFLFEKKLILRLRYINFYNCFLYTIMIKSVLVSLIPIYHRQGDSELQIVQQDCFRRTETTKGWKSPSWQGCKCLKGPLLLLSQGTLKLFSKDFLILLTKRQKKANFHYNAYQIPPKNFVEKIDRLGAMVLQTSDNSQLCIDSQYSSQQLTISEVIAPNLS